MAERQITGRHVLFGFVAFFGVIIAVNITMAYNAVASQSFDERRNAQQALGWSALVEVENGELSVAIVNADGRPVQAGKIEALVGRPTSTRDDFVPKLTFNGRAYVAPVELGEGKWIRHLKARSLAGEPFEQRLDVHVKS